MNDTHDRCFFTVQHLIQIRTGMNLFLRSVIALNQIPQIFRLSPKRAVQFENSGGCPV